MSDLSMLSTYTDVEDAMRGVVQEEFHQDVFFQTLQQGQYTMAQIRHFAIQYSYYSRHFPRVLGAAISAMAPLDTWWVPLADNLWDEAGRGVSGKAHERLYKTFLFSVDPSIPEDALGLPVEPMSPAVDKAIRSFIQFFYEATPLQAMAAVGLGSEMFAGDVMGTIAQGLRHPAYNCQTPLNLTFWDVHADEHEPHHYQLCKDILEQHTTPAELQIMFDVGHKIAASEARMYRELHAEMLTLL